MNSKSLALALLAALAALWAAAPSTGRGEDADPPADGEVVDSSYVAPDGARVLQQSIVIPTTLDNAWKLFTTSDGWKTLGVGFAQVDFRLGGEIETSYDARAKAGDAGNIKSRVLAYLPLRMFAIQATQAPPGFPEPQLLPHLFSVFQFDELDEQRVRVTVSGVGYRKEPAYDRLYKFFEMGNAWTLRRLRQHFLKER
jgi:hypothetical protein